MKLAILVLLAALPAIAQTPKPEEKPAGKPKVPTISDAQKKDLFKASAEFLQAQAQAQQAQQIAQQKQVVYQAAIKNLQDACGKDATPNLGQDGEPSCVAAPKPKEAEAKK